MILMFSLFNDIHEINSHGPRTYFLSLSQPITGDLRYCKRRVRLGGGAFADDDINLRNIIFCRFNVQHLSKDPHSAKDFPKHNVFSIEPICRLGGDEKLTGIGIRTCKTKIIFSCVIDNLNNKDVIMIIS